MVGLAVTAALVVAVILIVPRWLDDIYYIGPASDHYDGERFFNPNRVATTRGLAAFLRWQMNNERVEWPRQVPVTPAKPAPPVEGGAMIATVVGHAGVLVQVAGLNILTDPVYSERTSPFSGVGPKRVRAPGIAFDDLPKIDVVLVSHNHYDHLDLDTLANLWARDRPIIVTPLGNGALMARRGITAVARDWGERIDIREDVQVTVERVQHWSSRWQFDANRALWGGFSVSTPAGNLYFAGDCGYSDAFAATGAARGPYRLALIPVGAYEPRWFMKPQHMNPEDAVQAFRDLRAETAIGIHWGVWQLTDEAIDAPRQDLAKALAAAGIAPARFQALEPGQVLEVPLAAAASPPK